MGPVPPKARSSRVVNRPRRRQSSFSIGPYIKFDNDANLCCVSVHHSLKTDNISATAAEDPLVQIQQPSFSDFNDRKQTLEHQLLLATEGLRGDPSVQKDIENELEYMRSAGVHFGSGFCSEMTKKYKSRLIDSDFCVIKIAPTRAG